METARQLSPSPTRRPIHRSPGSARPAHPLLDLQAAVGNAAVASLVGNRADSARPAGGPSLLETFVVSRYESGEHAQAGSQTRTVVINGVTLSEGELIAMGDFFESTAELYKAPTEELQKLVDLIRRDRQAYQGVPGVKPVSNAEWADATKGRPKAKQFLELAKRNDPHFAPRAGGEAGARGDYRAEWRRLHGEALLKTIETAAAGTAAVPPEAMVTNAFAAHFLTDAFSAGHLVNKDDAMEKAKAEWKTQKFDGWILKESAFTRNVAAKVLADPTVSAIMADKELKMAAWADVTPQRFSEFIYQMADSKPELFFNAFGRLIHDRLNESIKNAGTALEVTNERGDTWMLSGDAMLSYSPDTLRVMNEAVAQSYRNLEAASKLNTTPPDFEPFYKAVWDYTPRPTKAGQKTLDEAVATFTDPKNAKTVDAFAALAIAQIETLVAELTEQGYMRDKPTRPKPGTKLPDGKYVPGPLPGGGYIDEHGNVTVRGG